jgi:DNA-binding response OmpR family regulator
VYSEKKKILICEDNQLAMHTLSFILEKEGFKSDTAEDGNKALTLLQKTVYDLILMDIHLPFHSGLEVIKYLRSDLKMNTPVLVLTVFSDLQTQRQVILLSHLIHLILSGKSVQFLKSNL